MHALRAPGIRVVAEPHALDAAVWSDVEHDEFEPLVVRIAADEAFGIGATKVELSDPAAIIVDEVGFVAVMFPADEFIDRVVPHIEWPPPVERPAFSQGSIASVPAKLYLDVTGAATVLVQAAYMDELIDRLAGPS